MKSLKSVFFTFGVFALLIAGLILLSNSSRSANPGLNPALAAEESLYDFGQVSMAKGTVSHSFAVKNSSSQPIQLVRLYTSCMCTTASVTLAGQSYGPFGMPGHGFISPVSQALAPGEQALVEVVFDPAAHGPAGVGAVSRTVTLETPAGPFKLEIKAQATP